MLETLEAAELKTIDKCGCVPPTRLNSARALLSIHDRFVEEDKLASFYRANGQAMINGKRPWDQGKLEEAGLGGISNTNFGEAKGLRDAALAPYIELNESVPRLADIMLDLPDPAQAADLSEIVSDNYDLMVKSDPSFYAKHLLLCKFFVEDGAGFAWWPDDLTWQFNAAPLGRFYFERDTPSYDGAIPVATLRDAISVTDLYHFIRDEEQAAKSGWRPHAVKKAIWKASKNHDKWSNDGAHWEDFEREIKENQVCLTSYNKVELIYGYVTEFSGKVSEYIANRDCDDEFLYSRPNWHDNINQCFVGFMYGVGEGTIHTIRGLKEAMFYGVQLNNRLLNRAADAVEMAGTMVWQPTGEEAVEFSFRRYGPMALVAPGFAAQNIQLPNISQNILPLYQQLSQVVANNTGTYQGRPNPVAADRDVTAEEIRRINYVESVLGSAAMNLFYTPYSKLHAEMYRRAVSQRLSARDKGGALAMEFRRRCLKYGITAEMLRNVKSVRAVRAIGNGSPQARQMQARMILDASGAFDEVGKQDALRGYIAAATGSYETALRYVPKGPPRTTLDYDIALGENADMKLGQTPVVLGHQNHFVHADIHFQEIVPLVEGMKSGEIPIEQAVPILRIMVDHTTEHVMLMAENPFRTQEAGQARRTLQMVTGALNNYERQILNEMEAAQAQQGQQQLDPKQEIELEKARIELQSRRVALEAQQEKSRQAMEQIQQRMALEDMKSRNAIAEKRVDFELRNRGQVGTINAPQSVIETLQ